MKLQVPLFRGWEDGQKEDRRFEGEYIPNTSSVKNV